jgi:hypothetical protein
VFSTSPFGCSWQLSTDTIQELQNPEAPFENQQRVGISIENWIGLWIKHFNSEPTLAFRDLYYVGYCG